MFIIETSRAKRTRKYSILMTIVFLMLGSPAALTAIFTLHWDKLPKKK